MKSAFDLFRRAHTVVEIFEKQRKPNPKSDRQEERSENCPRAIWPNRSIRLQTVIDHGNVVWLSGDHDVVLFRALKQTVEQRLIRIDLLLNDPRVDRCFVLRQSFRAL